MVLCLIRLIDDCLAISCWLLFGFGMTGLLNVLNAIVSPTPCLYTTVTIQYCSTSEKVLYRLVESTGRLLELYTV